MSKRIGMTLSICNYKNIYKVVVSFIKGTSTPTGLIIEVIKNDLFLIVIQARIQNLFNRGFPEGSKTRGSREPESLTWKSRATTIHMYMFL
jgi:hypothetical protein